MPGQVTQRFRIFKLLTVGGALVVFLTCGGGKEPQGPAGLSGSSEDPAKHYQLASEAVVVRDPKAVKQISSDRSTLTLDASVSGVERLAPGQVLLIPGVDVGKITTVNKSGSDVVVKLGPAKITDVIHDGVLQWGPQEVSLDQGTWIVQGTAGSSQARVLAAPPGIEPGNFFTTPLYADSALEFQKKFEVTVDDYKVSIQNSKDTWTLNAKKKISGVETSISIKVKFTKLETKGRIEVGYGTVSGYDLSTPVTGYIELEVTSTSEEARFFPPQVVVELPFEYVLPVPIYGIPCYVGLKLNFLIQPSLSTKNSGISMRFHSDFDGTPCVKYVNGELERCSEIKWEKPADPLSGVTATPSPGSIAMVFAVQCPKISFGVGTQSIVRGGAYVDMVTSLGANIFGATSLLPCRQLTLSRTLGAGLEFELGPELFKKLLEKLSSKVKIKMETKVELAREDLHWYTPPVKGCQ